MKRHPDGIFRDGGDTVTASRRQQQEIPGNHRDGIEPLEFEYGFAARKQDPFLIRLLIPERWGARMAVGMNRLQAEPAAIDQRMELLGTRAGHP